MKKTKVMRLLSLLLVMTLISTCAISGTFAKYVTKAEGEDQARVAKWGIVLTMKDDGFFKSEYETDDTKGYTGLSVKADNEDKLVAPGTSAGEFEATVKGTPEVATRYILEIPAEWADVVLKAGTYTDYTKLVPTIGEDGTTYGYTDTFTLDKDYAPVKWDITVSKGNTTMSLTQVAQAYPELAAAMGGNKYGFSATNAVDIVKQYGPQLQDLILTMVSGAQNASFTVDENGVIRLALDFEPGKEMDFKFTLKWAWEFTDAEGETEVSLNDKADTYLGNVAAGVITDDNASTDIKFTWTATAVQID